ncbi:MAG: NAD(P)/FAD-dependent oxidoreductase [Desulfosarcinaceae bacterium]
MTELACDVLVVGGGPAGATAARAAAGRGVRVLLVERRARIGLPVQCAEYIPAMLLGEAGVGRGFVVQAVKGMKTYLPGRSARVSLTPGYIIRRDLFDQALVSRARAAGVEVVTATRAAGMEPDGTVHLAMKDGRRHRVRPAIVIGADGPHSTVARWVGAPNRHLLPAVQVTVPLAKPLDYTEVYFDPAIYAGYGWLFPKGELANVGLGMRRDGHAQEPIGRVLDRFAADLRRKGRIAGPPVRQTAGWIPAEPVRQAVYGRVALVGDAAGHTHAITGAGVFAAVACGRIAGQWAGRAARGNDPELLQYYDREWQDLMALTLTRAFERRRCMESAWDDFDATIHKCWVAYREYYG